MFGEFFLLILTPAISSIVNLSLRDGAVPTQLKGAQLIPILKKHGLDLDSLNNYRPISNLTYISKLVERAVAAQLSDYLSIHGLQEPLQSAYHKAHSTETTITRVLNDLLVAIDNQNMVYVTLLDCSAAFDLVDHPTLIHRLEHRLGVTGTALEWFRSYLADRTQSVSISGSVSPALPLTCGVPQGSALGPKLFTIYTLPLGDIIRQHHTQFHLYADDAQLYLAFKRSDSPTVHANTLKKLEACIAEIRQWMPLNGLKLNDSKTEFMLLQSKFPAQLSCPDITIGADRVSPASSAKNLGVIIDPNLTMSKHVSAVCQAATFQLRRISRIRTFLTPSATKTLIHSLVTSRLDYCNIVLAGLPDYEIAKIQCILNAAARLTSKCPKFAHITPILIELHWLPVQQRILFKVLVLVYKALHDLAPPYIKSLITLYSPARSLRSSSKQLLVEPRFGNVSYGARAFSVFAPRAYNKLPLHIRQAPTLETFKSRLKTHLFSVFDTC